MGSHFLRDEPELPFSQMRWPKRGQADREEIGRGMLFFEGGRSKRAIQHPLNSDICSDGRKEGGHKMGRGKVRIGANAGGSFPFARARVK